MSYDHDWLLVPLLPLLSKIVKIDEDWNVTGRWQHIERQSKYSSGQLRQITEELVASDSAQLASSFNYIKIVFCFPLVLAIQLGHALPDAEASTTYHYQCWYPDVKLLICLFAASITKLIAEAAPKRSSIQVLLWPMLLNCSVQMISIVSNIARLLTLQKIVRIITLPLPVSALINWTFKMLQTSPQSSHSHRLSNLSHTYTHRFLLGTNLTLNTKTTAQDPSRGQKLTNTSCPISFQVSVPDTAITHIYFFTVPRTYTMFAHRRRG